MKGIRRPSFDLQRSEREAIHLLHLVANAYEPVLLFGKRQDGEIVG
jgi:hypothetical protein